MIGNIFSGVAVWFHVWPPSVERYTSVFGPSFEDTA